MTDKELRMLMGDAFEEALGAISQIANSAHDAKQSEDYLNALRDVYKVIKSGIGGDDFDYSVIDTFDVIEKEDDEVQEDTQYCKRVTADMLRQMGAVVPDEEDEEACDDCGFENSNCQCDGGPNRTNPNYSFGIVADRQNVQAYTIFVEDDYDYDNIGSHIPAVEKVMVPLGIMGEDMENKFSGMFGGKWPNLASVKKHIESFGWKYKASISREIREWE